MSSKPPPSPPSPPIKVMVADDEPLARLRIRNYLEQHHPEFEVIDAKDGLAALEGITSQKPDIVLLDIEMPILSGFDVLDQVSPRTFQVVFQTAYDEFAVKAFDANACDYLLKPFSDERLARALQKALGQKAQPDPAVSRLLDHLALEGHYLRRLAFRVGPRMRLVDVTEVDYFLSEQHATRAFLPQIDFVYDQSLTYLESRLDPKMFQRIHRNAIVKLAAIATLGANDLVLKNGVHLSVSRERRKHLRANLFLFDKPKD